MVGRRFAILIRMQNDLGPTLFAVIEILVSLRSLVEGKFMRNYPRWLRSTGVN